MADLDFNPFYCVGREIVYKTLNVPKHLDISDDLITHISKITGFNLFFDETGKQEISLLTDADDLLYFDRIEVLNIL